MTTTPAERLLTISEAADKLGVSVDTLRRWDRDGRLIAARTLGRQRRYTAEQVEAARPTTA